jgi:hypothetical protein
LAYLVSFNPQQVLGFAAMAGTSHYKSISDEGTWQDLSFPTIFVGYALVY